MKDLIQQYLDRGISRRNFLSGLGAVGMSTVAANSMARSLAPFQPPAGDVSTESTPSWMREVRGSGGALLVAQLKAAGVEYVFFSPSNAQVPIYDALVDEPNMHLIEGLNENALIAMANGYAKASGKTPFVLFTRPGLLNSMAQVFNNWKDQVPTIIAVDWGSMGTMGMDGHEDIDDLDQVVQPMTKWHWIAETVERIPDVTRRALKFASTAPSGPVFVGYPQDKLRDEGKALIMDQAKFSLPMKIRPDATLVEQTARLLLEARNPLLYVGDDIVRCGAEKEVVELAELLGLPVTRGSGLLAWSMPFPTRHPLYLGAYLREMRYPGEVDVMLNLGSRMPYATAVGLSNEGSRPKVDPKIKLIQIRLDPTNLAREYPTELPIVADAKLATIDLLAAIRSMASEARLKQIRETRAQKTGEYTAKMRNFRQSIARSRWDASPITVARMGVELEEVLEKDTCFLIESVSGSDMETLMSFGGADKQYFSYIGGVLGWSLGASFGVKLALPDRPVVAAVGDGAFQFGGPQALWSFARYRVPVTVIVMNNLGYNSQRSGALAIGGKQFQMGLDMAYYLGDPDMDFVKIASGFGVEGEIVAEPSSFRPALERAKRATAEGRPYLLDVHVERSGFGAASTWHPSYSIADLRQRKV